MQVITRMLSLLTALLLIPVSVAAADTPLVWELHGENNTVRIIGSIHVLREQDYPLPDTIDQAYQASDVLVLEVAMDDAAIQEVSRLMGRHGQLPAGTTLAEVISGETLQMVEALANDANIPMAALQNLRPWALAMALTMHRIQAAGYRLDLGVDMYLAQRARQDERPIQGLEQVEDQLRIFHGMASALEEKYLRYTLEELDVMEQEVPRLVNAWRNGDKDALESLLVESFREFPELYQRAMVDRNKNWRHASKPCSKMTAITWSSSALPIW